MVRVGLGGGFGPLRGGISNRGAGLGFGPISVGVSSREAGPVVQLAGYLIGLVVAVFVAVLALIVGGFVLGPRLIIRGMRQRRQGAGRGSGGSRAGLVRITGGIACLAASIAAVTVLTATISTAHVGASRADAAAAMVTVPTFTGLRLDHADAAVLPQDGHHAPTLDLRTRDLSPLHRGQMEAENWTVEAQWPSAGSRVRSDSIVVVFVLRNGEAAWFRKHRVMPKVPVGKAAAAIDTERGPFAAVTELLDWRYPAGKAPRWATPPHTYPAPGENPAVPHDPSVVPAAEAAATAHLASADQYGTIVGSVPRAGRPLRPGQRIVLLVSDR